MEEEYFETMDYETLHQDFDEIDLYGEKLIDDNSFDNCDLVFE